MRGFVVQRPDGHWYAHCIDLTIDALAPTRAEALQKVQEAMVAYLTWASEREVPLLRPSPLRFRLRYRAYALRDGLRAMFHRQVKQNSVPRTFHQPLPA